VCVCVYNCELLLELSDYMDEGAGRADVVQDRLIYHMICP